MGKTQSKEEIIIAQNAAGGVNSADIDLIHKNLSGHNTLLTIIVVLLVLAVVAGLYIMYKKCHIQWVRQELARSAFRRSGARRPGRADQPMEVGVWGVYRWRSPSQDAQQFGQRVFGSTLSKNLDFVTLLGIKVLCNLLKNYYILYSNVIHALLFMCILLNIFFFLMDFINGNYWYLWWDKKH